MKCECGRAQVIKEAGLYMSEVFSMQSVICNKRNLESIKELKKRGIK